MATPRHRSGPGGQDGDALDRDLVERAGRGDRGAVEQLLRDHYGRIYTLCRRICTSREQAEDATQNALVKIVRGLPAFDGRSKFSTWSYRIASNSAIDELRRSRRIHEHELRAEERGPDGSERLPTTGRRSGQGALTTTHRQRSPEEHAVSGELGERLMAELSRLDERFRIPMVLRDVAQFDYDEIAELLAIPPGTVRSRISRGRAALKDALSGTDLDPSTGVGSASRDDTTETGATTSRSVLRNRSDIRDVGQERR